MVGRLLSARPDGDVDALLEDLSVEAHLVAWQTDGAVVRAATGACLENWRSQGMRKE